jgi:hypothetical protein
MSEPLGHSSELSVIVLATQPRMLRQMMRRALQRTPGRRLVLETEDIEQVADILHRVEADWLIANLTDEDRLPEAILTAVAGNPSVSVMGISEDGSHVSIREPSTGYDGEKSHNEVLSDATLADLLAVIGKVP